MVVDKETALYEWAKTNPYLTDRLLFDFLEGNNGNCSISPIPDAASIKTYVDGSKIVGYTFAFNVIFAVSESMDGANIENMLTVRKWQHWINEQERLKNYPDFGDRAQVFKLENLGNMPSMATRYENGIAKYQFFARLQYHEGA